MGKSVCKKVQIVLSKGTEWGELAVATAAASDSNFDKSLFFLTPADSFNLPAGGEIRPS